MKSLRISLLCVQALVACTCNFGIHTARAQNSPAESPPPQVRKLPERCYPITPPEALGKWGNQSSQCYELNQTFDGGVYDKDNNIWTTSAEFVDLFGMPQKFVEGLQGAEAAAFRIEDASYQSCGFGGRPDACQKVEQCLLDIYFDERKTPLPWVTNEKSYVMPRYSSMKWLRPQNDKERPYGMLAMEIPSWVIRNKSLSGPMAPFADPQSKKEAIVVSNLSTDRGGDEEVANKHAVVGYVKNYYQTLSVVTMQFGCTTPARKTISVRIEAKDFTTGPPEKQFAKVILPSGFVSRMRDMRQAQSDRNAVFYRSLFAPPLGTNGSNAPNQKP
jgi:hypothetical protein